MKRSAARFLSGILSSVLVFALVLGGFGVLGSKGDSSVSVFAVGSDGSGSTYTSTSSTAPKKSSVKKAKLSVTANEVNIIAGEKTTLPRSAILNIKNAGGKKTYKIVKVSSSKKKFAINKKGKLTVKSGLAAGTYKVKISVKTTGSKKYKAGKKTVTVTVNAVAPVPAVQPAPATPVDPVTPTDPTTPDTPSDPGNTQGSN